MDAGAPEKKPVRLNIYNQTFSLLVSGDPADIEQAAERVDELMTAIARSGNMDVTRVAILACLHLQDRVTTLEHDVEQLRRRVDEALRNFSLLEEALSEKL